METAATPTSSNAMIIVHVQRSTMGGQVAPAADIGGTTHRGDAGVHDARCGRMLPQMRLPLDANAAQITVEMLPKHAGHAVQGHWIDARIKEAAN